MTSHDHIQWFFLFSVPRWYLYEAVDDRGGCAGPLHAAQPPESGGRQHLCSPRASEPGWKALEHRAAHLPAKPAQRLSVCRTWPTLQYHFPCGGTRIGWILLAATLESPDQVSECGNAFQFDHRPPEQLPSSSSSARSPGFLRQRAESHNGRSFASWIALWSRASTKAPWAAMEYDEREISFYSIKLMTFGAVFCHATQPSTFQHRGNCPHTSPKAVVSNGSSIMNPTS